jgi:hypothetical protein
MKQVVYKNTVLARNSRAYELWELWQSAKTDRNKAQRVLDQHMQEVEQRHQDLLTRYQK